MDEGDAVLVGVGLEEVFAGVGEDVEVGEGEAE